MKQDWMIQVLNDLREFAALNGLEDLVSKLDETTVVARSSMVRGDGTVRGAAAQQAGLSVKLA
ncbi:hypothetical protein [Palleronia sp.]|uniref:hypothetical protein n=1 Tax=Palleronia sp. TaxID=1940284 RepID=UPI0035C83B7F